MPEKKTGSYSNYSYFNRAFEQPSGPDQFDYIRRLTDRIIQEYSQRKIIAIGVLGNDIYDKLLILRAMRDQFPMATFFTTDLDAQLYYHTELPWTRNLIVASSYGLQLHRDFQCGIPPFRSTYQTSLFAAVLQALGIIKGKPDFDKIPPRIFEIGSRGAYDLTPVSKNQLNSSSGKPLHPERHDVWENPVSLNSGNASEQFPKWMVWEWIPNGGDYLLDLFFMFFLPIGVFGCLSYYNIQKIKKTSKKDTPREKYWRYFLIFCGLSFAALTACAFISSLSGEGEPITFFDGISIWPTEVLRLVSGILALYFLLFSLQEISLGHENVDRLYPQPKADTETSSEYTISGVWKRYQKNNVLKVNWIFIGLAAVVYLGAGYIFIRTCGEPLSPYRGELSLLADKCILISSLFLMLILVAYVINTTWLCIKFINTFTSSDLKNTKNATEILSSRCSLKADICRESLNQCKTKYAECLTEYDKRMADETSAYWLTIKIVGKKTKVVGETIKYPFLVLFLLLVARHKYFDNWTWTVPLAIVIELTTLIALGFMIFLFYRANKVRQQMIARLREDQLILINTQLPGGIAAFDDAKTKLIGQRLRSIEYVMSEIQNMKSGAFSPLISFRNPILAAILMPLGGMGSISLFQQLTQFLKY